MNQSTLSHAALLDVTLDHRSTTPLYAQLAQALRDIILAGRIPPGARLPSSRSFAGELSVSRATIVTAYDQLTAEGYVEGRHGAGIFVITGLPEDILQVRDRDVRQESPAPQVEPVKPFQTNSPDMRLFPHRQWAKLFQRIWTNPLPDLLANSDPFGWWPLRKEIADHMMNWRGISCQVDQVIITSGSREAMQLVGDVMMEPDDIVAQEEPGYELFTRVLSRAGITVKGVTVDHAGMCHDALTALKRQPRCVIVTPSRQYPLGVTMPLVRRLQMLNWAASTSGFIIEDDFDSEYRYTGQPLPAMMSLARQNQVIYLGSFSKVLSKSLRLGYMIVPPAMIPQFHASILSTFPDAAFFAQPVLAQFMANGDYASHIRRMRRIYGQRQKAFLSAAERHLQGLVEYSPADGGMHLIGKLSHPLEDTIGDVEVCRQAEKAGIRLTPLSSTYRLGKGKQGLIAGYAGFDEQELEGAAESLAECLSNLVKNRSTYQV